MITTLFNLFCPFVLNFESIFYSNFMLILFTVLFVSSLLIIGMSIFSKNLWKNFSNSLFLSSPYSVVLLGGFLLLASFNLISLVSFSYPVTTTLGFNLSLAFWMWLISVLIMFLKSDTASVLMPSNSPWYLASFLGVVELVSISVRPLTLCFRLLANMSAGHILLTLICKLKAFSWLMSGGLFGVLELMVALVQSFVFLMLISVYLQESVYH